MSITLAIQINYHWTNNTTLGGHVFVLSCISTDTAKNEITTVKSASNYVTTAFFL